MHNEELLLEKLNEILTNQDEIEGITVFYKNGKKLQIGSQKIDNEVLEVELAEEKDDINAKNNNTSTDGNWKYNKTEGIGKVIENGANSQIIIFPTGRKINVIY